MVAKEHMRELSGSVSSGIPLFAAHLLPQFEISSTADDWESDAMYLHQMLKPLAKFFFPEAPSTSKIPI